MVQQEKSKNKLWGPGGERESLASAPPTGLDFYKKLK
jgi:hypothetical protein